MFSWKPLERLACHPLVLVGSIAVGVLVGLWVPEEAVKLGAFSELYVRLLKMLVIPLVISAIVYNLRQLLQRPGSSLFVRRTALAFVAAMIMAGTIGVATAFILRPGAGLDDATLMALGKLIQDDSERGGIGERVSLKRPVMVQEPSVLEFAVEQLVPDNIFAALIAGDNLKVVIFALLFGVAAALVPGERAEKLNMIAHTVFSATLTLTRYFGVLLPPASLALAAHQVATVGIAPLLAMPSFLIALSVATLLAMLLCVAIIGLVSRSWSGTRLGLQEPFFMAIATRNSIACLPQMIDGLANKLHFDRVLVELVTPLGTSLVRLGPVLFYAVATLFIAEIYGRTLTVPELGVVLFASALAGFASAGMTGIVVIYQTALVCGLLNLPFEAALVLFLTIEPVSDILRTLVVVFGNMAVSALICPHPRKPSPNVAEAVP